MTLIDRIRLTPLAKNQLSTLKRRYSIEHYNTICRYALCLSLKTPGQVVDENFSFVGGLEIDWKTLTGGHEVVFLNLVMVWLQTNGQACDEDGIKRNVHLHLHRGLSFLAGRDEGLELIFSSRDTL
ncbi:DNA sulfur modification protein DndE [Pseudomonas aeruginosa]|uniref:DNA sulfur modification protein DndE n=1 Tax=Pseudomonas aeruginosa TaxID=287 RepID=UPI001D18ABEA|nr:DNA sulfur modification protein DndE [Pseudomonas aeruginosa]MCC4281561.1 DNA sulfur modification protein DndE [Pseudomonas aeruginosa]MEC4070375.1 DNA sulfur modification protein DndE [Pseudomonas aeruginosa]HBO2700917.1 DNA sulfur modification protein DndE [Pseudomonas aeruginosa]HEP9710525.1 DNA sulfur modification protein DndE [Pseudomonas aeruginosa]